MTQNELHDAGKLMCHMARVLEWTLATGDIEGVLRCLNSIDNLSGAIRQVLLDAGWVDAEKPPSSAV